MYTVRVEDHFAAAHFLSHYHGKCENLHGHNYRVRVWARGEELDEGGMLVDFGVLKRCLGEVIALLDHTNLNDKPEFNNDPSAERIARYIYEKLIERLPAFLTGKSKAALLQAVEVYETPTSLARYEG
jgi:6-pyruvoyltetrahydropterin/6-carboxytetrahydropterin synthase